ncbi:MAG: hypothetical protein JO336_25200 [Acidobacteriia bacterium]|nr:hypothetical protein [Terriglobia bacterium]MBV8906345.1 hypothetical protein [Terriglobia bacterium]
MNPVLIGVLCVSLAWLLYLMLRRAAQDDWSRISDEREGSPYAVCFPRRSLLNQCLSAEDLDFVQRRNSRGLVRLFLCERRRLAIAWLRQTRKEAHRLVRLHLHSVRYAEDVRLAAEARLLLALVLFHLVYVALLSLFWWYGPWQTQRLRRPLRELCGALAQLADRIVAVAGPALPRLETAAGVIR